jgi:hypothetical protein
MDGGRFAITVVRLADRAWAAFASLVATVPFAISVAITGRHMPALVRSKTEKAAPRAI